MIHGADSFRVVNSTSGTFIGPNPSRRTLLICAPATGNVTITSSNPAVQFHGVTLNQGNAPLRLHHHDVGDWITRDLYAVADADGRIVGYVEGTEGP